jgi:hypothetical protein
MFWIKFVALAVPIGLFLWWLLYNAYAVGDL